MDGLTGKIIRAATSFVLSVDGNRAGECRGCGACCRFVYKCPFLRFENHNSQAICTIYEIRPPMCRKYPRTKDEQVHQPCGYYFIDEVSQPAKAL
jgi:Fe-S-cluster containining protein